MSSPKEFAIRVASSASELRDVAHLRYEVHVEELGKKPAGADNEARLLFDKLDPISEVVYVTRGDEVIATLRTLYGADGDIPDEYREAYSLQSFAEFPQTSYAFCSRLMIKQHYRRGSLLNELLISSYKRGRMKGVLLNFIGCASGLISLYEVLGYRRYKAGIFRTELGNDFPLVCITDDLEYLSKVGSPWTQVASQFPVGSGRTEWLAKKFPDYAGPTSCRAAGLNEFLEFLAESINPADWDLLRGIESTELNSLLTASTIVDLKSGDYVIREGDYGAELFIILDGSAEVRVTRPDGSALSLESLGNGQVFGEMAFVTQKTRSADVVCTSDTRLLAVNQGTLERMIASNPATAARLLMNLTRVLIEKIHLGRAMLRNG